MEITQEKINDLKKELLELEGEGYDRVMEEKLAAGGPMESFHQSASANEQFQRWQKRVSEIKDILKLAKVIKKDPTSSVVQIGSKVDVLSNVGEETFQIVDTIEANPLKHKISRDSELGKLLIGQRIDVTVKLELQDKAREYTIVKVY